MLPAPSHLASFSQQGKVKKSAARAANGRPRAGRSAAARRPDQAAARTGLAASTPGRKASAAVAPEITTASMPGPWVAAPAITRLRGGIFTGSAPRAARVP